MEEDKEDLSISSKLDIMFIVTKEPSIEIMRVTHDFYMNGELVDSVELDETKIYLN